MQLPRFEQFEIDSQIRRPAKSVKSNIVEGYGRRKCQKEYIRFLTYAQASNDETLDHLETLCLTGSLSDKELHQKLKARIMLLGKKINLFIHMMSFELTL